MSNGGDIKDKKKGQDHVKETMMFKDQAEQAEPAKMAEKGVGGGEPVG